MERAFEIDKAFAMHLAKPNRLKPDFVCGAEWADKHPIYDDTPMTKEYLDKHYSIDDTVTDNYGNIWYNLWHSFHLIWDGKTAFAEDAPYLRIATVGDLRLLNLLLKK